MTFCTSTKVAAVKSYHRAASQFLIPAFLFLRTNYIQEAIQEI